MAIPLRLWLVTSDLPTAAAWRRLAAREGWIVEVAPTLPNFLAGLEPNETGFVVVDSACLGPASSRPLSGVRSRTPRSSIIVLLPAHAGKERLVETLESGADDYLLWPMPPELAAAKLRAHLRRLLPAVAQELEVLRSPRGDLKMETSRREVWIRQGAKWKAAESLTAIETKILALFLTKPGAVFERGFILESVWGGKDAGVRPSTVDKHVEALRRKLGRLSGRIRTVYGSGYTYKE